MTSWPGTHARTHLDILPPASVPLKACSSPEPPHALPAEPGLLLAGWGRVRGQIDAGPCQLCGGHLYNWGIPISIPQERRGRIKFRVVVLGHGCVIAGREIYWDRRDIRFC